jgi:Ion channel
MMPTAADTTSREHISPLGYLRRTPSAGLLLIQLLGILLYPWMETAPRGRALFGAFGLLILGGAMRVVRRSPWLTWLALVLGLMVVALSAIHAIAPHPALPIAIAIALSVFYFYATGSLIAYMLQDWVATTDELFAAGATFTLLAWAFAHAYAACEAILPGSFSAPINPAGPRSWMELLFLSVAVLSSVGLSDILPVTGMARALVMLESFAGVMYVALVVSRLIGLTMLGRERTEPPRHT